MTPPQIHLLPSIERVKWTRKPDQGIGRGKLSRSNLELAKMNVCSRLVSRSTIPHAPEIARRDLTQGWI